MLNHRRHHRFAGGGFTSARWAVLTFIVLLAIPLGASFRRLFLSTQPTRSILQKTRFGRRDPSSRMNSPGSDLPVRNESMQSLVYNLWGRGRTRTVDSVFALVASESRKLLLCANY